jgi:hypothetical protein
MTMADTKLSAPAPKVDAGVNGAIRVQARQPVSRDAVAKGEITAHQDPVILLESVMQVTASLAPRPGVEEGIDLAVWIQARDIVQPGAADGL